MSIQSIDTVHLSALQTAEDIHELFRRLGYPVKAPDPFEGDDLDALELSPVDRENVKRAYVVSQLENHIVFLYEVEDLRMARLRALAWNILQRGTGLLVVTTPIERGIYREILFVDPRFAGKPNKSGVRVNKLKVVVAEPTRHDLDTLNAIHAHRNRSGQQVYDAQGAAFNVTTITKHFYDNYRLHYERAKAAIQKANPSVADFYDADKLHAFTQRLLGRLMFLYFLQRKGWLGERPRFLTDTYRATQQRHAGEMHDGDTFHYYREVLEPLFFETMNTKRPGDITRWEGIRIPYLNGGLFDEARDPAGPILIPDAIFDPNDVNGLLGFFNRYNFTIANDTPLEQDVAVDPEMLGKVFENLLEERDRGQSGSFYTPRPIVAYMCQEALAGYLQESAGIPREQTRALFDPDADAVLSADEAQRIDAALDTLTVLDPAVGSGSFLIGMLNEILRLRRAAYTARHADPEPNAQTLSDWKEAIIRDTLYGVDIKPEAIEIAQLRLWLALVVDQTLEQARPLPNLDYKLMAGNSLIETIDGEPVLGELATQILSADDSTPVAWDAVRDQLQMFDPNPTQARMLLFEGEKEAHHERIKLDEMRREYFSATPERRKQLKPQIMAQERQIVAASLREKADAAQAVIDEMGRRAGLAGGKLKTSDEHKLNATNDKLARLTRLQEGMAKPDVSLPFFLYRLHFSEVFEGKGGFDIVIANPPYVNTKDASNFDDVNDRKAQYGWTDDLYSHFIFRGFELARSNGYLAYITSDTYFTISTKQHVRGLLQQVCLECLVTVDPFDATVDTAIFIARNLRSTPSRIQFVNARFSDQEEISLLTKPIDWTQSHIIKVEHGEQVVQLVQVGNLRCYSVPFSLYLNALKNAFFEPSRQNVGLYSKFMHTLKILMSEWGNAIETSRKFSQRRTEIEHYQTTLNPGDITLVGLLAEGGQGMATGDNGKYLGYLEGSTQATNIIERREALLRIWRTKPEIWQQYEILSDESHDFGEVVDQLKQKFDGRSQLDLKRGEIYKIVPREYVFNTSKITDANRENIIQQGLEEPQCWLSYRKGDREGNRWVSVDELYIDWSKSNVKELKTDKSARWQGYDFFLTPGITWSDTANHAPIKARLSPICIFDVSGMRLTPIAVVSAEYFLAFLNTNLAGYISKKFYNNTQKYQIGDLRLLPIVIPTDEQHKEVNRLTKYAITLQTEILALNSSGKPNAKEREELEATERNLNAIFAQIYGVEELGEFTEF